MTSQQQPGPTIAQALAAATAALRARQVADARRDAVALLMHTLACDRAFLLTHDAELVAPAALAQFHRAVERRAGGEPLQYITGEQEFYGLVFEVTPDVLIPRPETELLVEVALALLRETRAPQLCDVGTGSGCIPVALLHERADAHACGLDISPAALAVAARNAARHGVAERLRLVASDCFGALERARARFTMILSNPPYIAAADLAGLQREVRDFEPRVALTPGGDGLSVIRRLIADAPRFLLPGGHLLFEIGFQQHEAVTQLIEPHVWTLLDIHKDLQGIPRTVALRLRG
ncbi:MAG TPA: peptide chain release factor N(5)-glutamine methyltransferase [Pyrinomonadaceae bacterium]|jgi:release factor glutamine methyltransferase